MLTKKGGDNLTLLKNKVNRIKLQINFLWILLISTSVVKYSDTSLRKHAAIGRGSVIN